MEGKYYHMTSNVSEFLETASEKDANIIVQCLDHYISEYYRIRKGRGPVSAAWNFHNLIDAMLSNEKDDRITCVKGCHFCCTIHVDITEDEGELLIKTADTKEIKINRALLKRQAKFGPTNWKDQPYKDWGCVFLNKKEGICKVYENRPAACRNHAVITDPVLCDPKNNPDALTARLAHLMPNLVASAMLNVCESKSMAKTILDKLK